MNIVEADLAVAEYQLINSEAVEGLVADCGLAEQDLGQSEEEERCGQAESVTLLPDISGILQTKSFFFSMGVNFNGICKPNVLLNLH